MDKNYFKGASTEYFGDKKISQKPEKESIEKFQISTGKYKKRETSIEIVEYEIKD